MACTIFSRTLRFYGSMVRLNSLHYKKLAFSAFAITISIFAAAQNPPSGIIVGVKVGPSKMLTEISSDFSETLSEFDHKSGLAADIEISKLLFNHFEVGSSLNYSTLQGSTDNPQFTAIGNHHSLPTMPTEPVEYHNRLLGQKFFVGYYFRNFSEINRSYIPEPFLRAGIGYTDYAVELKYKNPESGSIFGKGTGKYDMIKLSTVIYHITAGLKTYITPQFFMNISYSLNYVPYDFLDGVYNYNSDGSRAEMNGLYSEIKLGFFFQSIGNGKRNNSSGKRRTGSLPFSSIN